MIEAIKYPRTKHLFFSEGRSEDDEILSLKETEQYFGNKVVVITEKMDGECTTIYDTGRVHARSLDSAFHISRTYVRKLAGEISYKIPKDYRLCGENVFAKHSIEYKNLEDYFLVFNIWDENNRCLSWQDTITLCQELNLKTVPVLYLGKWPKSDHSDLITIDETKQEGYVIRLEESFHFTDFGKSIAKYVRKNHIQTSEHWTKQPIIQNGLLGV